MGFIKLPTYYGVSLAKHMVDRKLNSTKSHDYHMLMQQVLLLCLRRLMSVAPCVPIMSLTVSFNGFVLRFGTLMILQVFKKMLQLHFPY
jgi:hypothetical protein